MGVAFAVVVPFFWLGNASGHDFEFHVLSWMEVVNQWKQGILLPRWAQFAHWGYGEARFLFYPPASWNLGALLGVLLPWKMAPGAYIWCALTASGCSMFLLARRWVPRNDALFATAFYVANPYHLVIVYWRSAMAELLAGCLLPLLVLWTLRAEEEGVRAVVPLSLIVAASWATNAPSAVMINYSLALLIIIAAIFRRNPRLLFYGAAAVVLGGALAAFYVLPAAYEQKWVNIGEVLAPGLRPQDNFLFARTGDADHNRFNLLISLIGVSEVVALAAAVHWSRRWRQHDKLTWYVLTAWGVAAVALMFSVTRVFWQHLPELRFVQLPWRWLLSLNVVLAMLVPLAWRRWSARIGLGIVLFAVTATVWVRVQPPWWDRAADIQELHDFIEDGDGYEGVDEYVPAGADPYELKKDLPQISTLKGEPVAHQTDEWKAESKHFSVEVSRPERLRLRLLNYPAWRVEVNGREVKAATRAVTGEIVFPVEAGKSDVRVTFTRTRDRFIGVIISLAALVAVLGMALAGRRRRAGS